MIKKSLFFLFVVTFLNSQAQNNIKQNELVGKWKYESVYVPESFYYNFEKDSLAEISELITSYFGNGIDSATYVNTTKKALQVSKGIVIEFKKNLEYFSFAPSNGSNEFGTYEIDISQKSISIKVVKSDRNIEIRNFKILSCNDKEMILETEINGSNYMKMKYKKID